MKNHITRIVDRLILDQTQFKRAIEQQLLEIMRTSPPNDAYQRGYAEALIWTWQMAGWPDTPTVIAVRALARAPYVELPNE